MKKAKFQHCKRNYIAAVTVLIELYAACLLTSCKKTNPEQAQSVKEATPPSVEKIRSLEDIIPAEEIVRISEVAKFVGKVVHCNLEWKPFYDKFMKVERKKSWTEDQIALIGVLFGAHQWRTYKQLSSNPCTEEEKKETEELLKSKIAELDNIKFSETPTLYTNMLYYKLGENQDYKGIIKYPVALGHAILAIRFVDCSVDHVEGLRVPNYMNDPRTVKDDEFSQKEWKKATGQQRLCMARDLITRQILNNKNEEQVTKFLGKPDGAYFQEYGYKIISQ